MTCVSLVSASAKTQLCAELDTTALLPWLLVSPSTWREAYYLIDVGFGTFITHDIRIFVEKNDVLRTGPTPRESESLEVALKKKNRRGRMTGVLHEEPWCCWLYLESSEKENPGGRRII